MIGQIYRPPLLFPIRCGADDSVLPMTVTTPSTPLRREQRKAVTLSTEITYLKGAGPAVAAKLSALELLLFCVFLFNLTLCFVESRAAVFLSN